MGLPTAFTISSVRVDFSLLSLHFQALPTVELRGKPIPPPESCLERFPFLTIATDYASFELRFQVYSLESLFNLSSSFSLGGVENLQLQRPYGRIRFDSYELFTG
jgi:hypothetical protein